MDTFWEQLGDHLERGANAFVAVVTDHTRHSPGTRGAAMFVRPDGSQVGTIGGGGMEADYLALAQRVLDDAAADLAGHDVLHHRRDADGKESGLICAGKQDVYYFTARPRDAEVFSGFSRARHEDRDEYLVVTAGSAALATEPPFEMSGPSYFSTRGESPVYAERSLPLHRIAIIGGGHCGLALSRTMGHLGYHVTVIEDRPHVFTLEANEWADRKVVVDDYREAGEQIAHPELTHLVVMTAAMPSDVDALEGSIRRPFPYKGVMGSRAKLRAIRERLMSRGIPREQFDELYAPVGLSMTSNTPEEIAISIAAQILRERESLFPWARPSEG